MSDSALPRSHVLATVGILLLSIVSSLLGLFRAGHYAVDPALLPRFQAQDGVILIVAVPVLAIGCWYATGGSLRGRIVWLGALAFMTYVWTHLAIGAGFGQFFLGYVALFSLSLSTLVAGLVTTNADAVARSLDGRLAERVYGTFLVLVAIGLSGLWLSEIVPATLAGTTPTIVEELGPEATLTYALDLGVIVPALVLAAVWLWQRRPWGYVFTGVLLVMAAILAPSITAITVMDVLGDAITVTTPVLVGSILPPAVAAAFAVKYVLAIRPT